MALKPCRECGKDVSTAAKSCPSCGVKSPTRKPKTGTLLAVLAVVVAIAMIRSDSLTSDVGVEEAPSVLSLEAAVRASDLQLSVSNLSAEPWTACEVTINGGILGGGYKQDVAGIGPGETVEGGLRAFADGDGRRFDPAELVLQDVMVACDTPRGRGYYTGRYE